MTLILLAAALAALPIEARSGPVAAAALADASGVAASLEPFYRELHRSPELSLQEVETAAKLAERVRGLGYEVTTGVGGTGVVAVLRNGTGPTVLLRTDMDALPVKEETGLAYASTVTAKDASGAVVPVMHACGHDLHMTSWVGAATVLARAKDRWRGTVVLVGQPAEEIGRGARAMIADGLFTRFPRPDFALAIHTQPGLPAGRVAVRSGPVLAAASTVEIVVHGRGGHGAYPHLTIDPVLLASRIVVSLQAIVARETNPLDPAVVTVGSIRGGTRENVIPDEVTLRLTVRSYDDAVQRRLLGAIHRVARGEAVAAGAPEEPTVTVEPGGSAHPTINDVAIAERLRGAIAREMGPHALAEFPPVMVAEDFSEFGHAGIRSVLLWVGSARDAGSAQAVLDGKAPGLHTSRLAPELTPTLRTAITALSAAALELLGRP